MLPHLKAYVIFFPSLVLFPTSVLTLLKVSCCSAGEVGYRMLGCYRQLDARLLCVCAIAQYCSGLLFPSNGWEVG